MGDEMFGLFAVVLVAAIGFVWVHPFRNRRRNDAGSPGDGGTGYRFSSDTSSRDPDRGGSFFGGLLSSSDSSGGSHDSGGSVDSGGGSDGGGGGGDSGGGGGSD